MEQLGLTRIPYYSELSVFNRSQIKGDNCALVLSVMLYWHSKDKYQTFNTRLHLHLLARNLRIDVDTIKDCLEYLHQIKILDKRVNTFTTNSDNPLKKEKVDEIYALNFHNVHLALKAHKLNVPIKILRLASDDYFDLYAYLSPKRMPILQGLNGMIKGKKYEEAAFNVCKILSGICTDEHYEDFSYKALAPGWRMLCQPPATAEDLVARYLNDNERSVDIDLTDGAFFIPDGDFFGTEKHKIWHTTKNLEPRILASALYLCFASVDENLSFYSDLSLKELTEAFKLLYKFTGLKGRLDEVYYNYLDLIDEDKQKALQEYQQILDSLQSLD